MEFPTGNIAGDFDQIDLTCPKCGSNQVIVKANNAGYFEVSECKKCGYRKE